MLRYFVIFRLLEGWGWRGLLHDLSLALCWIVCGRNNLIMLPHSFLSFVRRAVSFRPALIVILVAFPLRLALVMVLICFTYVALEPFGSFFLWVELTSIVLQLLFKFGKFDLLLHCLLVSRSVFRMIVSSDRGSSMSHSVQLVRVLHVFAEEVLPDNHDEGLSNDSQEDSVLGFGMLL